MNVVSLRINSQKNHAAKSISTCSFFLMLISFPVFLQNKNQLSDDFEMISADVKIYFFCFVARFKKMYYFCTANSKC